MSAVVDSSEAFSSSSTFIDRHSNNNVFRRFSLLREKNIMTDAVISSIDGKRFYVHSVVMAGTSDYFFKNVLNSENHDTLVEWPTCDSPYQLNIDSNTLEMVITFCYSNTIEITADNVENVLTGAKGLIIESLIPVCCEILEEQLDTNNCIRLLEIADEHELVTLRDKAIAIISEVLLNVRKLPEYFNLNSTQIHWLLEQLSNSQNGIFSRLLDALYEVERSLTTLNLNAEAQSVFRSAFVAGFLMRNRVDPPQEQQANLEFHEEESDYGSNSHDTKSETEEQPPPLHVLGLLKRRTARFGAYCAIEQKWEKSSAKIDITHNIDSFRDAIMIPIDQQIVIFYMRNGSVSHAECLALETTTFERITLPNNIESANLALFCHLNDKIYCFARSDQQYFHGYDLTTKKWSTGQIDDVMDSKFIIGLNHELFFLGCGYNRTMVRSYHIDRKEWTARGNLRHGHKETCFKAVALNGSIYAVMSRFDSEKIYNGIEFVIQRYDDNANDWCIMKRIYYTHFVDCFNLEAAGNCLYLFYGVGDGEVQIYNEDLNDWQKGPTIDYNILDVAMCMVTVKSNGDAGNALNKSRSFW